MPTHPTDWESALGALTALRRARDREQLLKAALSAAGALLEADAAVLLLDAPSLDSSLAWLEGDELETRAGTPPQDSALARCRERGETVLEEDDASEIGPLGRSVLASPLRFEGEEVGALAVSGSLPRPELLEGLAEHLAYSLLDLEERGRASIQADRLQSILQATLVLNSTLDLDRLLELLMDIAVELTGADAGALLLREEGEGHLYFQVARGASDETEELVRSHTLDLGEGIAGWVAEHGRTVEVDDAHDDSRFSKRIDEATGMRTRALLCVPLKTKEETIGALEVIRQENEEPFEPSASVLLSSLASQAAIAVKNALLYRLAITDALTGLYSYRYFEDALRRETKLAEKNGSVVSLLLLDIDRFKSFNDTYGHKAGDRVLQEIAAVLKTSLRDTDVVARYGGEEIVVILRDTPKETAEVIAERVRSRIEEQSVPGPDGEELHVTVSVGISAFPTDTSIRDRLFYLVDAALYAAKRQGRNRAVSFRPDLLGEEIELG